MGIIRPICAITGLLLAVSAMAESLHGMQACKASPALGQYQRPAYLAMKPAAVVPGYCLSVPGVKDEQVCMSGPYQGGGEDVQPFRLSYRRDGKEALTWRSDGMLISPSDTFIVELIEVDDAEAGSELIVPVMTSEGMGMGVQSTDVFVVNRHRLTVSQPLSVEDYGRVSGFYRLPGRSCRLLATRWDSGEDKVRGEGLYATGAWYRLDGLNWQPEPSLPGVSRRYLFRFERERARARQPLLWFLDKSAELQ